MAGVRDHTELSAWTLADESWRRVRDLTSRPQFRREPDLADQLRRSAEGPGPHIAEGFSRFHPKEFTPFLRIAKSSLSESIAHLARARLLGLVGEDEHADLLRLARRARGATTLLLLYLESDDAARFERRPRRRGRRTRGRARTPEPARAPPEPKGTVRNPKEPATPEPEPPEPRTRGT
jgi:four helix bundle protein